MTQAKKQTKQHWFLLSYAVPATAHTAFVSQFLSHDKKTLDIQTMGAARNQASLPEHSTLISISYIGFLTQDEFNPPPPVIPTVIAPTDAYMDGYHASVEMHKSGNTPVNPFVVHGSMEPMSEQAVQWADGLMAGCKRFGAVGMTANEL